MKIAIPTRGNNVDNHFGHCETYSIFTIGENNEIEYSEMLPAPQGCGCKSNIASVLEEKGVTVMLAGNMGAGALSILNKQGIKVYRGCEGSVAELVDNFLKEKIADSGESCNLHEEGHSCEHH